MKRLLKINVIFLLFISTFVGLSAKIMLPDLIGDNMVLKQKTKVVFWGWDDPGTDIIVQTSWNNKTYKTRAGLNGQWNLYISTPKAGGPYRILINGTDEVELENVLIGEVWFTSGQSNMGWSVIEERNAENVLKTAKHDHIRLFHVPRQIVDQKESMFKKSASWTECDAESVRHFSAMSYYFAVFLQGKLNIPIGVISASWAGTGIESWLSYDLQDSDVELGKSINRWNKWENDYLQDSIVYAEKLSMWKQGTAKDIAQELVKKPKSIYMLERPHCKPGALYNGMISPCMPYTISGLIWYQGENSVEWANEYEYQLQNMIDSWRCGFYSDFPVLVGQLTNFNYPSAERAAILRDAQLNAQKKKDTYTICTIDIGNSDDVHPNDKLPFGRRFADMALDKVYGKSSLANYPVAEKAVIKDNKIIVYFNHAKGLHVKGDILNDIFVGDVTGKRLQVKVCIKRDKLIIHSSDIQGATKVGYAVDNNVKANLYNENNLPAFPFTLLIEHSKK